MKISNLLLIIWLSVLVLASCGKTDTDNNANVKTSAVPGSPAMSSVTTTGGVATPDVLSKINVEAEERQRIAKLDKLTEENLKTQTVLKDGKTILNDRRLFANYLKSKGVDSAKKLLDGMVELNEFAKKSNIELTPADIRTIMYATDAENKGWDMCGEFKANQDKLDKKNQFYATLETVCPSLGAVTGVPATPPK